MRSARSLTFLLGNQLFHPAQLEEAGVGGDVFMAEDLGLCTYVRHHQQKIVLFLASMRRYAAELRDHGYRVHYEKLDDPASVDLDYEAKLGRFLDRHAFAELHTFEIEDKFFEKRMREFARRRKLPLIVSRSPMFMTSREDFAEYLRLGKRPFMKTFYELQRRKHVVLVNSRGEPEGGRWSFDEDNRRKLPAKVDPPPIAWPGERSPEVVAVIELVERRFGGHPGKARDFWLPTSRGEADAAVDDFLNNRFAGFGPYEDAITSRSDFVFHSTLSPLINLGLVTPRALIDRAVSHARAHKIPMNSLEGFVRQIIGWREFVRGIYQNFSERQDTANHWRHHRGLKRCWYDATTGIPPLDDVIRKAQRFGWTHHIERLMIVSNLMLLSEVEPRAAHRWFMEMYVDSSDWVMGPNVYGMGLFSDGGIFATKPYISGSNYILKMSDYAKGPWCETWDGLYWSFVAKHQAQFIRNPRMATIARGWDRIADSRRKSLLAAAEEFKERVTIDPRSRKSS